MITYTAEVYESGAWAALKSWVLSFTDGECLDEGLDEGSATLSMSERTGVLKPFTRLRFTVTDGTDTAEIDRVVMSDVVKMRRVGTE